MILRLLTLRRLHYIYYSDIEKVKSAQVPEFTSLVNFPAHMSQKQAVNLPDGMRCCVMCGQACPCSSGNKNKKGGGAKGGSKPQTHLCFPAILHPLSVSPLHREPAMPTLQHLLEKLVSIIPPTPTKPYILMTATIHSHPMPSAMTKLTMIARG